MAVWTLSEIPWTLIAAPLAAAEDAVARLDERLSRSSIRDGWIARTHFTDACDSLWLAGELVHVEDLVLHNERMDVRTPTHEITRAHIVLRARRRILDAEPGWALSREGLDALRGRSAAGQGTDCYGSSFSHYPSRSRFFRPENFPLKTIALGQITATGVTRSISSQKPTWPFGPLRIKCHVLRAKHETKSDRYLDQTHRSRPP